MREGKESATPLQNLNEVNLRLLVLHTVCTSHSLHPQKSSPSVV